jgi:hypothetical protein
VRVGTIPNHVCVEFRFARENERVCARGHATKSSLCLREKNRVGVCVHVWENYNSKGYDNG